MKIFKPPSKYRSCSTKKKYTTELEAKAECNRVTWITLCHYKCFYCSGWHVCKQENYIKFAMGGIDE